MFSLRIVICVLVFRMLLIAGESTITENKQLLKDEDKRAADESLTGETLKSPTKRGIYPTGGEKRFIGSSGSGYGYGYGSSGNGYPSYSSSGHTGDDRPSYYEPHGRYPSAYGPGYDPPPLYHGGSQYPVEPHEGYGGIDFKMSSLKKILLPLAGLAILGVAAAASQNPVLLQLGSINGRRRRSLPEDVYPSNPLVRPAKLN